MLSAYLIDIMIMLLAAVFVVPLTQIARLGAVPGFLIAGIIVGPSGMSLIDNISEIGHFAEIGVVLLLFVIGIELKPARLWLMRRLVFGLGSLQVSITALLLGGIAYLFLDVSVRAAVLIGPALALSSTAFVLQLLTEQRQLNTQYGRASFAVLLLQDLAVVPLLALVPLLAFAETSVGADIGLALLQSLLILVVVVLVGRHFLHPILYRVALSQNSEIFTASAVLIVLGAALATEHAGLSMAMGAFLAGMLISDSSYRHQVMAEILPFRGLLLGLFFMSMGMSLNLGLLLENPVPSIVLVVALMVIKAVVLLPLAYLHGLKPRNALATALILAQSGEFALVLFSLANQSNLIGPLLFQQLLLIVLLSMIATPILAQIAQQVRQDHEDGKRRQLEEPIDTPIVLAGFGRVGHRIGEVLARSGHTFVALDSDAAVVKRARGEGHPVFYGDVRKADVLRAAGASNANVIVVTLNDPAATKEVVDSLRTSYPHVSIYARGHSLNDCLMLRGLGASGVVSENIEASLALAHMVLTEISAGEQGEIALDEFRRTYHAQIDNVAKLVMRDENSSKKIDNKS